jgi:hypothetical protein
VSPTAPSNGEIMRRLDELVTELRRLADTLAEGYVRKDVLAAQNNATSIQITGIEDEQHVLHKRIDGVNQRLDKNDTDRQTDRRLIFTAIAAPIVVGIVLAIVLSAIGVHR